jgi:hypothetical protein
MTLMALIMLHIIHHTAADLLVASMWHATLPFVNKVIVLDWLLHLSRYRFLPEKIAITKVNLNCLVMAARYEEPKLPERFPMKYP